MLRICTSVLSLLILEYNNCCAFIRVKTSEIDCNTIKTIIHSRSVDPQKNHCNYLIITCSILKLQTPRRSSLQHCVFKNIYIQVL